MPEYNEHVVSFLRNKQHIKFVRRINEVLFYDLVNIRWRISPRYGIKPGDIAGYVRNNGYRAVQVDGIAYQVHNLIWLIMTGEWPKGEVDHKDRNRDNNSWSNLRDATRSQNKANSAPQINGTSGYKGVTAKGSRWEAQIHVKGRKIYLGLHKTKFAASLAYYNAAKKYFGEFARLDGQNLPEFDLEVELCLD